MTLAKAWSTTGLLRLAFIAAALLLAASFPAHAQKPGPSQENCKVGAYITSIHDIDTVRQTFSADAWIWSVCPNRDRRPLQTMEFTNADEHSFVLDSMTQRPAGAWSQRRISGTFRHHFDVDHFPFDRHRLTIGLEEGVEDVSGFAYSFDPENSGISPGLHIPDWKVTGFTGALRTAVYPTNFGDPAMSPRSKGRYTHLDLVVDIRRAQVSGFFKLTVPAYVAAFLALISMLMYVEEGRNLLNPRIALLAGLLFAVVFNLRAIDEVVGGSPTLTLLDLVHFSALALILTATLAAIRSSQRIEQRVSLHVVRRSDRTIMYWGGALFVAFNSLLILGAKLTG